jgi:hypothetical protein
MSSRTQSRAFGVNGGEESAVSFSIAGESDADALFSSTSFASSTSFTSSASVTLVGVESKKDGNNDTN